AVGGRHGRRVHHAGEFRRDDGGRRHPRFYSQTPQPRIRRTTSSFPRRWRDCWRISDGDSRRTVDCDERSPKGMMIPDRVKRSGRWERGILWLLRTNEAPLDFRILGRSLFHAALVGAAAGLVGAAFFAGLEYLQRFLLEDVAGYVVLRASGETFIGPS